MFELQQTGNGNVSSDYLKEYSRKGPDTTMVQEVLVALFWWKAGARRIMALGEEFFPGVLL